MESIKPVTRALQTLAAIESESRELILAEAPSTGSTEIDAEIVPLVQKIEAGSIAEIEKVIGEMQEAKNFLQTEWERIQRETARYMSSLRQLRPRWKSSLRPCADGAKQATPLTTKRNPKLSRGLASGSQSFVVAGAAAWPLAASTQCSGLRVKGLGARHLVKLGFSRALSRADVRNRVRLMGRRRRRGARASSALIAANSFSMARADGAPSVSFRRVVSASSWRTSS